MVPSIRVLVFSLGILGSLHGAAQFSNPLLSSGADPWITQLDGWYYYTHTSGNRVEIRRTQNPVALASAEKKVIWHAPDSGMMRANVWAPEIHFLRGKWYAYFAADDGQNRNHRMWVLECDERDPFSGNWTLKGKIASPDDHWAIDGTVLEWDNKLYFAWSGWEGDRNGMQHIYLSEMENPWTLKGDRVLISSPSKSWELNGHNSKEEAPEKSVFVNEGPQFLIRGLSVFIVFSANGCWTDHYALGLLQLRDGGDFLNPLDWVKSDGPIFQSAAEKGVIAPGHNSFFKSPDGSEWWILYHANSEPGQGCGRHRSPRAQPFTWSADGLPQLGEPVAPHESLPFPKGIDN